MKVITCLLLSIISLSNLIAQEEKTITVSGESTIQISPNEIILRIDYQEYWDTPKNEVKTTIKTIEKQILKSLKTAGVKDENVTLGAVTLLREYDRSKRIYFNRRLSKRLNVCVYSSDEIEKVIEILEGDNLFEKAISQFQIASTRHTDKEAFEKQAKREAIVDAKNRANLILEAVGKKTGEIIKVKELSGSGTKSSGDSFYSVQSENNSGVSAITVVYKVEAVFIIE